jgi:thiol peroxidase
MTLERTGLIKFRGVGKTILGPDIKVGGLAPEFLAVDQDWVERNPLQETKGKVRVLAALPSLDTDVCSRETHRFNNEAASLGKDVSIFAISMDLPYAQKRWCGAAGVDQVVTLSDHLHADFGSKYGCLIKEVRLLRRAVFVIDRQGKVVYSDYMPALGEEPDYDTVLSSVQKVL